VKYTPNIFSDYTKHFHSHLGLALIEKGSKSDSLSSIALDACFFDQSHMNRNFKTSFGTSPQTYKKVNIVQDM
jgi:transcriptional regulator GlxA family with amidase domain